MRAAGWIAASVDHRRWVVGVFLLATAAWGLALPRLRLATDGRALFPPDHPAIAFQEEIDARFRHAGQVVIGVEGAGSEDLFSPAGLGALLRLTEAVAQVPGVDGAALQGLATVVSPVWSPAGLVLEPVLLEPPASRDEARAVRARAAADPLLAGTLLSRDGSDTALYLSLAPGTDRRATFHRIESAAREVWADLETGSRQGLTLHFLGPAAAESLLGEHVLADLATLLPLSLALVAVLLWLWFRRLAVVVAGLGEAVAVVAWSLGLLAATGKPLSLVTVVMPVILATYCVADTIHVAQRFLDRRRERREEEAPAAMKAALAEIRQPVVFTSVTTAAGFLAFAVSPIPPLQDFGLFTAFGVLVALAVSLLVVPGSLLLVGLGRGAPPSGLPLVAAGGLRRAAGWAVGRPLRGVVAFALLTAALVAGLERLEVQDSWVGNFDPESPLRRSDEWFNQSFAGSHLLNVVVAPAGEGGVLDPPFLALLARLQAELGELAEVGGSRSLVDSLGSVARTLEGDARLPRSEREARQWALLVEMAGGAASLAAYLDPEERATNLWVFLEGADYRRTERVLAAARQSLNGGGGLAAPPAFAGDAYLGYRLVGSIAAGLRSSLALALAATFALILWMLGRPGPALLVTLPVALAVVWNLGAMGWAGLPLGVATSTFSAVALGVGIDFSVHWIARLRLALTAGRDWQTAVAETAGTAGGAVLLHGLVLVLGFGVLLASSVPPNRRLGALMGSNLLACLAATLLLLPAAATLLRRRLERSGARRRAALLPPLLGLLLLVAPAAAAPDADGPLPDGREVMKRVNLRPLGGDARLSLRLTLHDPRRGDHRQEVELSRKAFPGGYRSLYRITGPESLAGLALLVAEDDALSGMWMYFPATGQVVKVASRGLSALATDFTCEDLRVTFPLEQYHFATLRRDRVAGRPALVVERVPATERLQRELGWSRSLGWVDAERWIVLKVQFFDHRDRLFKTFSAQAPEPLQGVWTLTRYAMTNHRAEHATTVEVRQARYDLDLPAGAFEPESLGGGSPAAGGSPP